METIRQQKKEQPAGGGGFGLGAPGSAGFVTLESGVYHEVVPAGATVAELRRHYGTSLDLDRDSRATVFEPGQPQGREVDDSYRPAASEKVSFTKRAGEKGAG